MKLSPTGLLICAFCLASAAADNQLEPETTRKDTAPPEHGAIKTISLGDGEVLAFIWIEPLQLWVGRFEVTNGQYRRYDPEHESSSHHGYFLGNHSQPVVMVTWDNARNYCSWLNRHFGDQAPKGLVFRLPTEREWEVFARCGDERNFPWGNEWPPPPEWNYRGKEGSRGIFRFFAPRNFIESHSDGFIVSAPVDESGVNDWGLYGVGGNVWEWCYDWFDGSHTERAIRGASWSNYRQDSLSISNRFSASPQDKTAMIGFRVVIGKYIPPPSGPLNPVPASRNGS